MVASLKSIRCRIGNQWSCRRSSVALEERGAWHTTLASEADDSLNLLQCQISLLSSRWQKKQVWHLLMINWELWIAPWLTS